MRIVGSLVILVGLVALCLGGGAGCKNKGNGDNGAADPAALKAQQDLIARRDKLLEARKRLQGEHDNLAQQVKESEAKGEDATELPEPYSGGTGCGAGGPMYWALGRISRLSAACSRMCAVHPITRLEANVGVNISRGTPHVSITTPA